MVRQYDDTIAAIATTIGRGALAMVRVSGADAHRICEPLVKPWPSATRRATLGEMIDPASGAIVDQVMTVVYDAPRSYTGEPMVEFTGHGGFLSPVAVAALLVRSGARQAEPGEFTLRAVLNGKMDLVQAEALADVVEARTDAHRRAALFQLDGSLSRRILALRSGILELEALLAYDIDFPEEDDGPIPRQRIEEAIAAVAAEMQTLLDTAPVGEIVREGALVSIAGPPNVGKSSLFNAFLGQERALVSDTPGTTRDAIEAVIDAEGWPVRLVDTAGLREGGEAIEVRGIEMSRRFIERSHVVLVCDEDASRLPETAATVAGLVHCPIIGVLTKRDRQPAGAAHLDDSLSVRRAVAVSSVSRAGLDDLRSALATTLQEVHGRIEVDAPLLTRARHRAGLELAQRELRAFQSAWHHGTIPTVIAGVHIRAATAALDELIGAVGVEDVLGRVFSSFCIGK